MQFFKTEIFIIIKNKKIMKKQIIFYKDCFIFSTSELYKS